MASVGAVQGMAHLSTDVGPALVATLLGAAAGALVLGRIRADALALGALAALMVCGPFAAYAGLAGGLGMALLHAARARRARHWAGSLWVSVLAFVSGSLGVALFHRFTGAGFEREVSALIVAAALGALPFLVPTDDEVAFSLRQCLDFTRGVRRRRLLRALALRRRTHQRSRALEAGWKDLPAILTRASDEVGALRLRALSRAERASRALARAELAIGSDAAPFDAEKQLAVELEAIEELVTRVGE